MGSFYTNLTLRSADTASVESALRALRREAAVSPPLDGYSVVFDRACEEQDTEEVGGLANELSKRLKCAVLAVINHDDSVLIYELHERGTFADHYISQNTLELMRASEVATRTLWRERSEQRHPPSAFEKSLLPRAEAPSHTRSKPTGTKT